jgi:NADPH2:quinone reductase
VPSTHTGRRASVLRWLPSLPRGRTRAILWQDARDIFHGNMPSRRKEEPSMSRVVQIAQTGGPEQLKLAEVQVGEPGAGQIRIRHKAVGLNFIDVYHRTGLYPLPLPHAIGMEASGVVEAVGPGVTHLKAGDRAAYASQPPGSYCELRVMPARTVCKLPDAIDFDTGAAMMLKGLTAQYLLRKTLPQGGLKAGDFVLFHAAAGGVGLIATQWAKAMGLQLIGTAGSEAKCALAKENGAVHVINYAKEDFLARVKEITGGRGVKVVYDSVGKDTWDKSLDCLSPFGLMASFGNASGPVPPFAPGVLGGKGSLYVTRQTLFTHIATREGCQAMADDLFQAVTSGQVKIRIDQRYPLEQVQQAHRDLEARKTTGSTILTL